MSSLSEPWLQEVVTKHLGLPAVSSEVVEEVLPFVELQVRRVIQQALKYQRRSKSAFLKVDDINLVLIANKVEPLYGLHLVNSDATDEQTITSNIQNNSHRPTIVSMEVFSKRDIPHCSLKPSVSLHWLAVNGMQPSIPENPAIVEGDEDKKPVSLPKELQYLYARITGVIKNFDQNEDGLLVKVLTVLAKDTYLQDLVPYLSHFCYSQVKLHSKNVPLLSTIIKAIHAIFINPSLHLESHLHQLLPAIFTCVVAAKLSMSLTENHWCLRKDAATLVALISEKYSTISPELHPRICKTYFDAISQKKSLAVAFGGVAGINALGAPVVRSLLLENLEGLSEFITSSQNTLKNPFSTEPDEVTGKRIFKFEDEKNAEVRMGVVMLQDMLRQTLGNYMTSCMQLPVLPWTISKFLRQNNSTTSKDKKDGRKRSTIVPRIFSSVNYPLLELEESLNPYFVKESHSLYYSRMVL